MARYRGPCAHCGAPVDRSLRPGREGLCLDCAIAKHDEVCRAMADGTSPLLEHCRASGAETGRQIKAKSGPRYEKWREAMIRTVADL